MKILTEADKGKLHEYFLWEVFNHFRFGDEVILYIIADERKVSNVPTGRCKV